MGSINFNLDGGDPHGDGRERGRESPAGQLLQGVYGQTATFRPNAA